MIKVTYISWIKFLKEHSDLYTENRKLIPGDNVIIPEKLTEQHADIIEKFFKEMDKVEKIKEEKTTNICPNCLKIETRCKCQKNKERQDGIKWLSEMDKRAEIEDKLEDKPLVDTTKAKDFVDEKIRITKQMEEEGKSKLEIKEEIKKLKKVKKDE